MPLLNRLKDEIVLAPPAPEPSYLGGAPDPGATGLRTLDDHRGYLLGHVETLRPFGINLFAPSPEYVEVTESAHTVIVPSLGDRTMKRSSPSVP